MFDSSTGFRLPDGSVLSPDAAAVRLERWKALRPEERRGSPPLCPDLVVELACPGDGGRRGATALRDKMATSIANGARLGWLLLAEERAVEIWRPTAGGTVGEPRGGNVSGGEGERAAAARVEAERLDPGRLDPGRLEPEWLEHERMEAERLEPERLEADAVLEGGEELPGLRLALAELWASGPTEATGSPRFGVPASGPSRGSLELDGAASQRWAEAANGGGKRKAQSLGQADPNPKTLMEKKIFWRLRRSNLRISFHLDPT